MANADKPNGLTPVGTIGHASYEGVALKCVVLAADTTDIAKGDLVSLSSSGSDATGKYPAVTKYAASGASVFGVCVGVEAPTLSDRTSYDFANLYVVGAGTADRFILVDSSQSTIFAGQEDSVGGALTATAVNNNIDIIDAGVTAATGTSGMELDSSTINTTNTLPLRVIGVQRTPDNALGTNCRWLTTLNSSQLPGGAGVTGV